jgi:hypothetical protein
MLAGAMILPPAAGAVGAVPLIPGIPGIVLPPMPGICMQFGQLPIPIAPWEPWSIVIGSAALVAAGADCTGVFNFKAMPHSGQLAA